MNLFRKKVRRRKPTIKGTGTDARQLAAILKQARENKGLVQTQLAQKIGTTKSAISRFENHAEDIRLSTLRKLAAALDLRLDITLS